MSELQARIDDLRDRVLRPRRPRLWVLRERMRTATSVEELTRGLRGEACWPREGRYFRVRGTSAPKVLDHAVYLAASPDAMQAAEEAARAFAVRLWRVLDLDGAAPTDVVWRVGSWGSSPDPERAAAKWATLRIDEWMAMVGGRVEVDVSAYTEPFAQVVRLVHDDARWQARAPTELGPSPAAALIELWRTGCALRRVRDGQLHLLMPERGAPPVRVRDVPRHPVEQAKLDAALVLCCVRPKATRDVLVEMDALLAEGADPDARSLADSPGTGHPGWVSLARRRRSEEPAAFVHWRRLRGCPPPLHLLAGHPEPDLAAAMMRKLLAAGATPGRWTSRGNPLNFATTRWWTHGSRPVGSIPSLFTAERMVQAGFPVDATDSVGRTALHHAATTHMGDVEALVRLGVPLDQPDRFGSTPLQYARATPIPEPHEGPLLALGANPDPPAPALPPVRWIDPPAPLLERVQVLAPTHEDWAVLADWWQMQGDFRGDLVAAALAKGLAPDMERVRWGRQLQVRAAVCPGPPLRVWSGIFEHNLLRRLQIPRNDVIEAWLAHPAHAVVRTVELSNRQTLPRLPARCPAVELVLQLEHPCDVRIPPWPFLRSLTVSMASGSVELTGVRVERLRINAAPGIAVRVELPALRSARLGMNRWAEWLPRLVPLQRLEVSSCDSDQLRAIAASRHAQRLEYLHLRGVAPATVELLGQLTALQSARIYVHLDRRVGVEGRRVLERDLREAGWRVEVRDGTGSGA
ncbi:MAG: ankyrin repeat domain-containing protein [Myxococcales bacterium]|nr:ankyrin repeat domain-containing protein [Myxococcales bacterium]